MPAFTLNSAVDHLLKKEFDIHRAGKQAHPMMEKYGIKAVPFEHPDLEKWRHNFTGIQYLHPETGFLVFGAIDDVWINDKTKELHIVDYKATSKSEKPNLEGRWQQAYKRQMEIYQWLFRQNNFKVSDTGYFVYVNGRKDEKAFDGRLEFDVDIISYKGNDGWIENTLIEIAETFEKKELPEAAENCEHCAYRKNSTLAIKELYGNVGKSKIPPAPEHAQIKKTTKSKRGAEKENLPADKIREPKDQTLF
ncbi:MAG: PD-(D/E)XK nuclease family protein [Candidatus Paceibacterota bacterium]|nr:MAG: PD-(D/E)XK nuclease family protein [Candidatus Paceibacterota bacterium]